MESRLESVKENPLMDRRELELIVQHEGEATPSEEDIKSRLAAEYNLDEENIIVDTIKTGFGSDRSVVRVKVLEEFDYDEELEEQHEPETLEEPEEVVEEEPDEEPGEADDDSTDYDEIVSGTISDAKDALKELEEPDYKAALEAEKENKNRTTFTDWLENKV